MKMRRFLSAILGLMLLAQGVVAAAAPLALVPPGTGTQELAAGMPCPGTAQQPAAGTDPCCDTDCAGMTGCALGHLAVAHVATFAPVRAAQAVAVAVLPPPAEAVTLPIPLRPPIVSLV